jgi:hypothetical protein
MRSKSVLSNKCFTEAVFGDFPLFGATLDPQGQKLPNKKKKEPELPIANDFQ